MRLERRGDPEISAPHLPAAEGMHRSGMACAEGSLWIGDFNGRDLVRIEAETGAIQSASRPTVS